MPPKHLLSLVRSAKNRRLNVRLLIWILAPTLLLLVGISQLHSFQFRRNSHALLQQSERAESKGDLAKAEEYLTLFLGYRPNHAEALARYSLIRAARPDR